MNVTCPNCHERFEDAECSTVCPHDLIMPRAQLEQKKLGLALLGKRVVFRGTSTVPPMRVEGVGWDGMVRVDAFPGEFAPHLFDVVPA